MVRRIKILSFGISINAFLFSSYHLYSLCCPVCPQIQNISFQCLQKINFHSSTRAGVCALSCWRSVCRKGKGKQEFTYIDFHPIFFTLCFPSTHLVLPRCEPFPGSWWGQLTFFSSVSPKVIPSFTLINQILLLYLLSLFQECIKIIYPLLPSVCFFLVDLNLLIYFAVIL